MNSHKIASLLILFVSILSLLISCIDQDILLHEYSAIDNEEWNINDSLHFEVDSVMHSGKYETTLELRTNAKYPYRNISIVMTQSLRNGNNIISKTLNYDIVDAQGNKNGEGITYLTHRIPFCTMDLQNGDTIDITIKHNMQDNILPGITDVGVLIEIP